MSSPTLPNVEVILRLKMRVAALYTLWFSPGRGDLICNAQTMEAGGGGGGKDNSYSC